MFSRINRSPDASNEAKASGNVPDVGQSVPGIAGKAVGAGLEPGSTDFGSSTAPTQGGRGGFGSDSSQSVSTGTGASDIGPTGGSAGPSNDESGGHPGMAGAGGNSVTATGRSINSDNRGGIGAAAVSGATNPNQQDSSSMQPGSTTRTGAGTTSVGTIGGGTMGTGTSGQTDRSVDVIEGRVAGPPGALSGKSEGTDSNAAQPNPDANDAWRRADQQRNKTQS